ncbi:MAG: TldD/PmbA family protein [archaeon]
MINLSDKDKLEKIVLKNAFPVELFVGYTKEQKLKIMKSKVKNVLSGEMFRLGIRVIYKGFNGFAFTSKLDENSLKQTISKAKKVALVKKEKTFKEFPTPVKTTQPKTLDKNLQALDLTDKILEVKELLSLKSSKKIKGIEATLAKNDYSGFLFNSNNISLSIDSSSFNSYFELNTFDKKPSNAFHLSFATKLKDLNLQKDFSLATKKALRLLNPEKIPSGSYDIILPSIEFTGLIESLITPVIATEEIMQHKSYLQGKLGKQVFNSELSITDNPTLDYFTSTQPLDDEGTKTFKKKIFNKGVFNCQLNDLKHAVKFNEKPSGNGYRSNGFSQPTAMTSNIIVEGRKEVSYEKLVSSSKKAIVVESIMGLHTANLVSGEFSMVVSLGKLVKNGCETKTIKNASIGGNILNFLKKDLILSKEKTFFGDSLIPAIKINDVQLV